MPAIYVIILNWNGWQDTLRCLHSLQNVTTPYQLILVDNGSTDDSISELRAAFPHLPIIGTGTNLGFAGGNNVGITHALAKGAEYILLLNNDTVVAPTFLQPLLDVMESNKKIAATNPKIYFLDETNRIWAAGGQMQLWRGKVGNRGRGQTDQGQFDLPEAISFGTGCCLLMRSQAIEQIGLLNDAYFAYYEDADWAMRAQRQGYQILYVPDSKIWHAVGSASKTQTKVGKNVQSPFVHYLAARNQLWFIKANTNGWQRLTALTAYLIQRILFYSMAFIALGRLNKLKALWAGFKDGITSTPSTTTTR